MAICGYNYKIGEGLFTLFDGMIDSMEEKVTKTKSQIQVLDDEIRELDIMIDKMRNKGAIQDIFIGLNTFAKHFFIEIRKQILLKPTLTIRTVADKIVPSFIMTVKGAEEFRNNLAHNEAHSKDIDFEIKQVADWVNKNGMCEYSKPVNLVL